MATATPPIETRESGGRSRAGLLTAALLAPASLWYVLLLILPMAIVVVFSFGEKAKNGGYAPAFNLDNYGQVAKGVDPFIDSLQLASHRARC